jgi:hypothetical protein
MGIEDWGYSEFLINYSQGFVRRGLTGEFALLIEKQKIISFYTLLSIFLLAAHITNVIILWLIVKRLIPHNNRAKLLLVAPGILLFPIWDTNAFIRKDHYLVGLLLIHALIAVKVQANELSSERYINCLKLILVGSFVVTLMHEANYFLLFVHIVIAINVAKIHPRPEITRKVIHVNVISLIIQTMLFAYLFVHRISFRSTQEMYLHIPSSLLARRDPVLAVSNSFQENSNLTHLILRSPVSMVSYFIAFLIGPFLIFWILKVSIKKSQALLLLSTLPQISLFIIGWDWGRWLWFLTVSVLALFVLEKDSISTNTSAKTRTSNGIFGNKIILIFLLLFHIPHSGNIRFADLSNIPIFIRFATEAISIIKAMF